MKRGEVESEMTSHTTYCIAGFNLIIPCCIISSIALLVSDHRVAYSRHLTISLAYSNRASLCLRNLEKSWHWESQFSFLCLFSCSSCQKVRWHSLSSSFSSSSSSSLSSFHGRRLPCFSLYSHPPHAVHKCYILHFIIPSASSFNLFQFFLRLQMPSLSSVSCGPLSFLLNNKCDDSLPRLLTSLSCPLLLFFSSSLLLFSSLLLSFFLALS